MNTERWDRTDIFNHLDEFKALYESRPIPNNEGGMKSPHMFPAWYIIKKLKPKFLIESGVWQGLGTWFFQQASPDTKIFAIDPEPRFRVYDSYTVEYQTEDFLDTDWESKLNPLETLVFFDDHQNCLPRLKRCKELGFKRVIVEDNYPVNQGDCYTPKKILSRKDYVIDVAGEVTKHKHQPEDYDFMLKNLSFYQEMPPIFKADTTRWGDSWEGEDYNTSKALLTEHNVLEYQTFFYEKQDYTWISYIELN